MKKEEKIKVGISVGDLNGIGTEVILKTFQDNRMLELCTPVIFGSTKILSFQKKQFNIQANFHGVSSAENAQHGKINVVNITKDPITIEYGKPTEEAGKFAIESFVEATKALKEGTIDILVTAPINKHNVQSEEFTFPGHTDYLGQTLEGDSLMLMVSNTLRVGLLTDHVAVKDVSAAITPELIEKKVNVIYKTLQQDFGISKPKIAVLGINPHVGDNGVIGIEDDEVLKPTLEKIKKEGKLVFGPYAADSFFASSNYKNFDAILAAYHDQGLIPFKTLSFGQGVNFTAGLNRVRTSPDHGTAYEIAGKNQADHNSFKEAVFTGIQIFRSRKLYKKLAKNPLKKQPSKI
ncbi:4-hydroxythreonine-4-phosphate dehydrogenase [Kordia periserrulae]|uniref:4-hydroxythreonine-4-phosphate dehydrogenase n=1 Tax=Kordia periserrulae TaxID=701523 RepID=A0A2T6BWU3_9FLAO|nr:4-hydroxythreonine-4-phosphate dehydrogenase PdxA [Kordia periserrulae]PTX60539.1 4-hydroxythreonine-4-phosphate dehydrogenase [Kordia periserrulae]